VSLLIEFTDDATAEFKESAEWYEEQQEGLSERFATEVAGKVALIANNPEIYPKSIGSNQEAVLHNFPFIILFRVVKSKNTLFILSIFHTSRHPKHKLRK
jgi:plasmid stabilization system protein ParE